MKKLLCLLLALALLCGGCAMKFQSGLADVETVKVESEHGFAFRVPTDWQAEAVSDDYTQYRYGTADGTLSFSVVMELGGMAYDSTAEIGAALVGELQETLYGEATAARPVEGGDFYRQTLSGTDTDGAPLVSELYLYAPFVSARYYLLFHATAEAYAENERLINDVIDSFSLTMSREEVYQHMEALREQAAQEALDALEQQAEEEAAAPAEPGQQPEDGQ